MCRSNICLSLIVIVAVFAAKIAAQETPPAAGPRLETDAADEGAAVKRLVDGIMQRYLAQEQRTSPHGESFPSEIHARWLHAPGAAADTARVGRFHLGNAG
jgi:hypothetical protein